VQLERHHMRWCREVITWARTRRSTAAPTP
jgi:hypothetical protein